MATGQPRRDLFYRRQENGGGTKDEFLMQLTANKTGIEVLAGPVEATAIGNLLSQLMASGEIADLAEGRKLVARSFDLKSYQAEVN